MSADFVIYCYFTVNVMSMFHDDMESTSAEIAKEGRGGHRNHILRMCS